MGALSWFVGDGVAGGVDLSGLGVVLVCRYDDDEGGIAVGSLALRRRARPGRAAGCARGDLPRPRWGTAKDHFPWAWKESRFLGASAAQIEIDHTPRRGWFRVRDHVSVRVAAAVQGQDSVTCVIPGHDRAGAELVVEELEVKGVGPLGFCYEGVCAYESTFSYAGP